MGGAVKGAAVGLQIPVVPENVGAETVVLGPLVHRKVVEVGQLAHAQVAGTGNEREAVAFVGAGPYPDFAAFDVFKAQVIHLQIQLEGGRFAAEMPLQMPLVGHVDFGQEDRQHLVHFFQAQVKAEIVVGGACRRCALIDIGRQVVLNKAHGGAPEVAKKVFSGDFAIGISRAQCQLFMVLQSLGPHRYGVEVEADGRGVEQALAQYNFAHQIVEVVASKLVSSTTDNTPSFMPGTRLSRSSWALRMAAIKSKCATRLDMSTVPIKSRAPLGSFSRTFPSNFWWVSKPCTVMSW